MPLIQELNLFFVHVPKTGGKAVTQYLRLTNSENQSNLGSRSSINRVFKKALSLTGSREAISKLVGTVDISLPASHLKLSEIHDFFPDYFEGRPSFRIFTVFRCPYERSLSIYHHFYPSGELNWDAVMRFFTAGIRSKKQVHQRRICLPQAEFISDCAGRFLVDDLIDYRRIDFAMRKYVERNGSGYLNRDLPRVGGPRRPNAAKYPLEFLEIVNEIYADDIKIDHLLNGYGEYVNHGVITDLKGSSWS